MPKAKKTTAKSTKSTAKKSADQQANIVELVPEESEVSRKTRAFREKLNAALTVQPQEMVSVTETLGRVLADDVRARATSPCWDIAAVDGYAVRTADLMQTPATLERIGESRASSQFHDEVRAGQAVKIFAGAPIPVGADAVVPMNNMDEFGGHVTINEQAWHGENICSKGIDFSEGESVLKAGSVVTARDIGLAASMKVSWFPVRRKPRIALFAIGDELAMLGDANDGGRVNSSSSLVLSAFITACGATPVNLGIASDSAASVKRLSSAAKGADLLVTTGGVSESADNLLKKELASTKNSKLEEISLKLSKEEHVVFGSKFGMPVLALPGNPMSAQICAALFLRTAIEKMLDMCEQFYKKSHAVLGRQLDCNDVKMDYIFAKLMEDNSKRLVADPASSQDRMLMSALAEADCLVTVDQDNIFHGDPVEITRFTCSVVSG